MNREEVMKEYRSIVGIDSAKARTLIKKLDYKEDYYLLKCIAQTYLDESRFENDDSMRVYFDRRKWRIAERYIIKAFEINPDCAEVLYTMGEVRKLNNQKDIAIYCFEKIIELGKKGVTNCGSKRGIDFAKELINDSKFELYRLYYGEDDSLSRKYLAKYKKGLESGIATIFKPLNKFLLTSQLMVLPKKTGKF